jgi:hypothetical protein
MEGRIRSLAGTVPMVSRVPAVIPAKAGIQCLDAGAKTLDPGFRRDDGFAAAAR